MNVAIFEKTVKEWRYANIDKKGILEIRFLIINLYIRPIWKVLMLFSLMMESIKVRDW